MKLEAAGEGKITVKGDVINAEGDVHYGMDEKQFAALLKAQEERIVRQLKEPGRIGDDKERLLLERKLKDVQEKLADIKKSYEEELKKRKAADEALAQMKGQLPEAKIEQAQASLRQGDKEAAKQVFRAVVDKEGAAVALAAYQLGQMAESELDYTEAMRQYKKAVMLEENNPEYLNAAGLMAGTMGEYRQAEDWFTRLLKIREQGQDELALARVQHDLAWCL